MKTNIQYIEIIELSHDDLKKLSAGEVIFINSENGYSLIKKEEDWGNPIVP
jgi:hypothetical protein